MFLPQKLLKFYIAAVGEFLLVHFHTKKFGCGKGFLCENLLKIHFTLKLKFDDKKRQFVSNIKTLSVNNQITRLYRTEK